MSVTAQPVASSSTGLGYTIPSNTGLPPTTTPNQIQQSKRNKESDLEIRLEFGGGLHLLFSSKPKHTIFIPSLVPSHETDSESHLEPPTVRYLIRWMKENLVSEREEMFGEGDGIRPGILVLINDADWELEGELEYKLQDRDEIVFISTLHGG